MPYLVGRIGASGGAGGRGAQQRLQQQQRQRQPTNAELLKQSQSYALLSSDEEQDEGGGVSSLKVGASEFLRPVRPPLKSEHIRPPVRDVLVVLMLVVLTAVWKFRRESSVEGFAVFKVVQPTSFLREVDVCRKLSFPRNNSGGTPRGAHAHVQTAASSDARGRSRPRI